MDDAQLEAYMDAQCAALGLVLAPAHRPGVLRYLALVAGMAPKVMDFPLTVADESGSTFVPVSAVPSASPEIAA
ncbi:MAG: DUF4089 domain-containing protein [Rubrivivax sp.]|nr:DUF4089 domain-containing protein [Rubrivivax sp.]